MIRTEHGRLSRHKDHGVRLGLPVRIVAVFVALVLFVAMFARGCATNRHVSVSENGGVTSVGAPFDITDAVHYVSEEEAERNGWSFCSGKSLIGAGELYVSAESAVLCTEGGRLIYGRNANERMPMASITKVMTAIVVIENVSDISCTVKVAPNAVGIEGSSVYLGAGDEITVLDLLYALMLASANDAAVALAMYVGSDVEAFVEMMNTKAELLGMSNTHFRDPHGLGCDGHFTTATDYARLMSYAIKNETFMELVGTRRATLLVSGVARPVANHNRLLYSCPGMLGGKTGYTVASGRTLVTACRRGGITLICVTLNASDDWNDHRRMYDAGFAHLKLTSFSPSELANDVPVTGSDGAVARSFPEKELSVITADDEVAEVRCFYPRFVYAPLGIGDTVGVAVVYIDGVKVGEVALVTEVAVEMKNEAPKGFFKRFREFFGAEK